MEEGEESLHLSTIESTKKTFAQQSSPIKYQATTTSSVTTPTKHYCWLYEDIVLKRADTGLGFTITGGSNISDQTKSCDRQIYITKIMPGSAAALDGRLHVNDCIISVNDLLITDVTHTKAVEILNNAGTLIRLSIKRKRPISTTLSSPTLSLSPPKSPLLSPKIQFGVKQKNSKTMESQKRIEIQLKKSTNGRFGFSISGGVGNQQRYGDNGIFVTRIQEGGSADIDGQLEIGDRLIAVRSNDIEVSLENVSHDVAVDRLGSVDTVTLIIDKKDFSS